MHSVATFQRDFDALLKSEGGISDQALRRALVIHRNTSMRAALDAIEANYPVVAAMVGPDAFAACARSYACAHPPADPRLCIYGERFSDFLSTWQPFEGFDYLPPVAALERLVTEALFAPDAKLLDPAVLVDAIELHLPLILHPATRVASFDTPAAGIWLAHQPDAQLMLEMIDWEPQTVLVTRPALNIEVRRIDRATQAFLEGTTLREAALGALEHGGDISTIFASLLTAGAFSGS